MTGALVVLVARGVQDLYLTGDPQITFFKVVYRRHTNFAVESVRQSFSAPANFGTTSTCTIGRVGDLISQMFLHVRLPSIPKFINEFTGEEDQIKKFAWTRYVGYSLIKETTFEIGGKLIDRQYGEWLYIWEQLTTRQNNGTDKLVGNLPELYNFTNGKPAVDLYIPLKYYFNRNNGLALPLIALASVDVKITFTFRKADECYRIGPTYAIAIKDDIVPFVQGDYISQTVGGETIHGYFINFDYITKTLYYIKICNPCAKKKEFCGKSRIYNPINNLSCEPDPCAVEEYRSTTPSVPICFVYSCLYVNYIYLDLDERAKFARSTHEYLMEQIQYNEEIGINSTSVGQNLNLSHPCKSHYWIAQLNGITGCRTINDRFNFTTSPIRYPCGKFFGKDLVKRATLLLNGNKRFKPRSSEFFNLQEPYSRHYRGPVIGINMYSFCFNPEEHQPSGAINMSKFDYIQMDMELSPVINMQNICSVRSYTLNYNILRIFFNLGGLAFD